MYSYFKQTKIKLKSKRKRKKKTKKKDEFYKVYVLRKNILLFICVVPHIIPNFK